MGKQILSDKKTILYIVLSSIFITNALIAEIIGVKIFSIEKLFNIAPITFEWLNNTVLTLNMSVGILIWPIVFITSDIINEYFGRRGVRRISFITAIMIGYSFLIIFSGTQMPPSDFWLEVNDTDAQGNYFNINYAYSTLFSQSLGIIVGSITAFLVGQLVDVYTFHYIRGLTGHKKLWLRATGSTIVSQFIDSFLILFIAFYWLGNWTFGQVIAVGIMQYIYKVGFAIVLTPLIYLAHAIIDRYLGTKEIDLKEM